MVQGSRGQLYVRIGGDDSRWQPSFSNYQNYREYAQGAGWKVWVAIPGNPAVQQAPLKQALPAPAYRSPETIEIPAVWLQ
jgi:alpha-amylase